MEIETTTYPVKVHRHSDSDMVEVQVEDKTASCHAGNVGCAFTRALEWKETGRTVKHEGCVVGESTFEVNNEL